MRSFVRLYVFPVHRGLKLLNMSSNCLYSLVTPSFSFPRTKYVGEACRGHRQRRYKVLLVNRNKSLFSTILTVSRKRHNTGFLLLWTTNRKSHMSYPTSHIHRGGARTLLAARGGGQKSSMFLFVHHAFKGLWLFTRVHVAPPLTER